MATTKIWKDTIRKDRCRSAKCRRVIWWAQIAASRKFMCFDQEPEAIQTEVEVETQRELLTVTLDTNHWATCPGREEFKRKGRRA